MAANALKKITTRAKQIRRAHPGTSWKGAVKKAGAEYRSGKKAPARKKAGRPVHRKARSVSGVRKSGKGRVRKTCEKVSPQNRRIVGGSIGNIEPKYEVVHQLKQVSGISYKGGSIRLAGVGDVNRQKAQLKASLGQQAGWLEVAISSAKTQREKNALRKKKREIVAEMNRIK
jgi:hypothetical protein